MATTRVDVREAQRRFTELLNDAMEGNEVIIAEGDVALARLTSIGSPQKRRVAGLNRGALWTSDDFDDPLSEDFWAGNS